MTQPYAPYVPYDYPRVCDLCGELRRISELHKQDQYWICDQHPGWRTKEELSRGNARGKPFPVIPVENPKPEQRDGPFTYEAEEGQIFNFLCSDHIVGEDGVTRAGVAPYELLDVSGLGTPSPVSRQSGAADLKETPRGAAWPILYLYDLIQENKRPRQWMSLARATVTRLANWLTAHQLSTLGTGLFNYTDTTLTFYGGWAREGMGNSTAHVYAEDVGACLLAMLRAWQITGTGSYLTAAQNAATCLRRLQCGGLRTSTYLVTDAASTRMQPGPHSRFVLLTLATGNTTHSTIMVPADLIAIEALTQLKSLTSDATYGDAAAVGEFTSATAATLTTAISQARTFWQTGAVDATGATVVGLSSATPKEYYAVSTSSSPAAPSWNYFNSTGTDFYITARNWALAVRSLNAVEGYSSQVADLWTFLRATADDPSLHINAALPDEVKASETLGTFDPTIAPAVEILVSTSGTAINKVYADFAAPLGGGANASAGTYSAGPLYDFVAAGLMAPLTASRMGGIKTTKNAASTRNRRLRAAVLAAASPSPVSITSVLWTPAFFTVDSLNLNGKSGLSFQTGFKERVVGISRVYALQDTMSAAMVGGIYRQQPAVFPVQA